MTPPFQRHSCSVSSDICHMKHSLEITLHSFSTLDFFWEKELDRLLLLFPALGWSESRLLLVWRCLWWQCKWKQNTIITCHDNIAPSVKHNATVYKAKYTTGKFEYIFHRLRSENYIKLFRGRNKLQRIWEKGPYSSFQRRLGLCAEYI